MATSFVFRPHVHGLGAITTPDIAIDDLVVVDAVDRGSTGATASHRVSIDRLTTEPEIQQLDRLTVVNVAVVMIPASFGTLVGIGADLIDHRIAEQCAVAAKQMCGKPLGRDAWRLDEIAEHFDRLILRSWSVHGSDRRLIQEVQVTGILPPSELMRRVAGERTGLPRGTVLFCTFPHLEVEPIRPPRVELELNDPSLNRQLRHAFSVRTLPGETSAHDVR